MVELACDDFSLASGIVEVVLLAGDFEMSAAGEVAIHGFFPDDLFDAVERLERGGIHAPGPLAAIPGDELVHAQFHPGEDHSAIAGTGAPADGFGLQHGNFRPTLGERARGREPGETCPDHRYIHDFGKRT